MSYGATARRVPAKGAKNIADVDVYKAAIVCKTERGVDMVHEDIYSFSDFAKVCGSYMSSYLGAYAVNSFYKTLLPGVNVEMKVRPVIATDAVQAAGVINDGMASPQKVFDIKAALKGLADKSAFGNKIGYKVSQSFNFEYKLAVDSTASASTTFQLTSVEHLKVDQLFKVVDTGTSKTEWAFLTGIVPATNDITFAALSNASAYAATTTTFYRADVSLYIAVKDETGVFIQQEAWLEYPFYKADTDGIAYAMNHAEEGSYYAKLTFNSASTATPDKALPAAVTTWTALTAGADGTAPVDGDYLTNVASLTDKDFMILLAPESSSFTHNNNMTEWCSAGTYACYWGQSSNQATEATLRELGLRLRQSYRFGIIPSDKWIEVEDQLSKGLKKAIPQSAQAAAHWFNNYSIYGIGKVAAGNVDSVNTTDSLLDSNGLVHNDVLGRGERLIRNASINIAQFRRGKGITINSARTLSTDKGYTFQNQVMGFLLIKKSILVYLQTIEQDPSGVDAQDVHRNAVYAYMKKKYDAGVFFKGQKDDGSRTTMEDVVQIVNDFSVNTLSDIANGKETVFVQVIFAPPIEEPVLDLASASVTTIRA